MFNVGILFLALCSVFFCSESCNEVYPLVTKINGRKSSSYTLCGQTIGLTYDGSSTEVDIAISGSNCKINRKFYKSDLPQKVSASNDSCEVSLYTIDKLLQIVALSTTNNDICIERLSVCNNVDDGIETTHVNKRSIKEPTHGATVAVAPSLLGLLYSCGFLLILSVTMLSILLSCCKKKHKEKQPDCESTSDNSTSSSQKSLKELKAISSPALIAPRSPSPAGPEYITPPMFSSPIFNIPDVPPSTPPRPVSRARWSFDKIKKCSSEKEHHYQTLDPQFLQRNHFQQHSLGQLHNLSQQHDLQQHESQPDIIQIEEIHPAEQQTQLESDDEDIIETDHATHSSSNIIITTGTTTTSTTSTTTTNTTSSSASQQQSRDYFVLDVSSEASQQSPQEPTTVDKNSTIYHTFEPQDVLSTPHSCSLCSETIQDKQESIYLVILPDEIDRKEVSTSKDNDPIYQVLEEPSVICRTCLDDDPIYAEVNAEDVGYALIAKLNHQSSDTSHTYSTVSSIDFSSLDYTPANRKTLIKDIKDISTNVSGDYASIPNSPMNPATAEEMFERPRNSSFSKIVFALRDKFKNQLKQSRQQQHETSIAANQDIQEDTDKKEKVETVLPTSPTKSLTRSKSHNHQPQILIAQRQKSGSYHVLNVEDVWQHQLANRYAPVAVVTRQPGSPLKLRKLNSLRSRKSYILNSLENHPGSAYEVPLKTRHVTFSYTNIPDRCNIPSRVRPHSSVIPPPQIILTKKALSHQDAINDTYTFDEREDEETNIHKLYCISEPCLSLSLSDDYDHFEKSALPPSPLKQRHILERSISSTDSSPVRLPRFQRLQSADESYIDYDDQD